MKFKRYSLKKILTRHFSLAAVIMLVNIVAPCAVSLAADVSLPIATKQFDVLNSVDFAESTTSKALNSTLDRLETLQSLINASIASRDELKGLIRTANSNTVEELKRELEAVNANLTKQQLSFEQIAIGGVDLTVLSDVDTGFDWRLEVSEILQPIVENLKVLTDKPRKISKLQALMEQNSEQQDNISSAIASIDQKINTAKVLNHDNGGEVEATLIALKSTWVRRLADNKQQQEVAAVQLAELQNPNISWWQTARDSLIVFSKGSGLTLLIAFLVVGIIWFLMRSLLRLLQFKTKGGDRQDYRTRRRLAQYGYRALTFLICLAAMIAVFYVRGDMLLMGLSILAAAGIAVGLRQTIPRFINEAKILLNIGAIRENERVMYKDLPWLVASLNMYSILRNPELTGVFRLPLNELSGMISRPAGKEPWFPSSKGDFIVLEDGQLREVIRQTPETVELKDRGGTITSVATPTFFNWTFHNLSRSETFGINSIFGIDYQHQGISLSDVPKSFKEAIEHALSKTEFADLVKEVAVELQSAGESSLDYWIHVTMDRQAASGYSRLQRLIQQTCIAMCTSQQWNIPFPHLTVQNLGSR